MHYIIIYYICIKLIPFVSDKLQETELHFSSHGLLSPPEAGRSARSKAVLKPATRRPSIYPWNSVRKCKKYQKVGKKKTLCTIFIMILWVISWIKGLGTFWIGPIPRVNQWFPIQSALASLSMAHRKSTQQRATRIDSLCGGLGNHGRIRWAVFKSPIGWLFRGSYSPNITNLLDPWGILFSTSQ